MDGMLEAALPSEGEELETVAEAPGTPPKRLPAFSTETSPSLSSGSGSARLTRAGATQVDLDPELEKAARSLRRITRRVASRAGLADLRDSGPARVGNYELRGVLGSGGCGSVYAAWDLRHDREVALKLMYRDDERGKQRFLRELRAIARLRHPNVVPLIDSGEHEGKPYLVMERVRGRSLAEASTIDPLPLRRRVELVVDACRALDYVHGEGLLHRDVKPQNVLIDRHGEACVVDFGLARAHDDASMTRAGAPIGTPAYMPPEQAGGLESSIDRRSDVYALGATLYHALCGRPPYKGPSDQVLAAVLRDVPQRPSARSAEVPPELDAVVMRCLEKDPGLRYPTAGELADDLERWLRGEPVLATPVTSWSRLLRYASRERTVVVLLGLLLASLCTIVILLAQNMRLASQLGS